MPMTLSPNPAAMTRRLPNSGVSRRQVLQIAKAATANGTQPGRSAVSTKKGKRGLRGMLLADPSVFFVLMWLI
ncbi:hypothetical protein NX08_013110 [Xanthomonas vasicola]|nr:hypothetical protein NX08_013110 [Xanthomonas vasicola]